MPDGYHHARASFFLLALALLTLVAGCADAPPPADSAALTVYSGRGQSVAEPLVERFEAATGIAVDILYGDSFPLAERLLREGDATRADVFWAQEAGALGTVADAGLFAALPDSLLDRVPPFYRNAAGTWLATSGRARILAYAPARVDAEALPATTFDLADSVWAGRVGWAPGNASFKAFVTAMRVQHGDARTRAWLEAMQANDAQTFASNRAIFEALAKGRIDLGLPNHYYLPRFKANDAAYPVEQAFFVPGDVGNLLNVAGAGVLATSDRADDARRFLAFLITDATQRYFVDEVQEYPVRPTGPLPAGLVPIDTLSRARPTLDLDALRDHPATVALLRELGLL